MLLYSTLAFDRNDKYWAEMIDRPQSYGVYVYSIFFLGAYKQTNDVIAHDDE